MIASFRAANPGRPLYRRRRSAVILLLAALACGPLAAQRRLKPEQRLRALGVLELENSAGKARARLWPVCILDHGQYFDASLYKATPRPMTLEPGIVYEAFRTGESAGLFTVGQAVEEGRAWFALGEWEPPGSKPPEKPVVVAGGEEDEGPPRLRRGASEAQTRADVVPEPPPDPDRPILHRGKPQEKDKPAEEPLVEFKPAAAVERLAVISDQSPAETRPYGFPWSRDEEERLNAAMRGLAGEQLARYLASRPGPKLTPAGPLDAVQVHAFDVNYDNEPEVVITASRPVKAASEQRTCYITVVARSNVRGELRRLFSQVTDSRRLDSVPRLELIDAVDSDGDGVAELLFRRIGATTTSYALYRVTYDSLWLLFEGAVSPN